MYLQLTFYWFIFVQDSLAIMILLMLLNAWILACCVCCSYFSIFDVRTESSWTAFCLITLLDIKFVKKSFTLLISKASPKAALTTTIKCNTSTMHAWNYFE